MKKRTECKENPALQPYKQEEIPKRTHFCHLKTKMYVQNLFFLNGKYETAKSRGHAAGQDFFCP